MALHINRSQTIAERLVKLRDYFYTNASPTHAVKMADILTYLANVGHEVEVKTVYSDLKTLEIAFGLDIHYDGRQRGYLLLNPPFAPYELRSIVNCIQAAKFISQQEADSLTEKVMRLADRDTRRSLNRKTFVKNRVRTTNKDSATGLDIIYEAIAENRKITYKYICFEYSPFGKNDVSPKQYVTVNGSKIITVSPYGVFWDGSYFSVIVAMGRDRQALLALNRMEQIKLSDEKRDIESELVKQLYQSLQNSNVEEDDFVEYYEDEQLVLDQIELRVANYNLPSLCKKLGRKVVSVTPESDQFSIALVHVSPTPDFYLWATTSFIPSIEIISPADASDKLKKYFFHLSQGEEPISPYC